jgi:hypothetical protein
MVGWNDASGGEGRPPRGTRPLTKGRGFAKTTGPIREDSPYRTGPIREDSPYRVSALSRILFQNMGRPRQTHCARGHELTEANSIWRARDGRERYHRQCRACRYLTASRYKQEHPELRPRSPWTLERRQKLFWAHVEGREDPGSCWHWTGARIGKGYGNWPSGSKLVGTSRAHRIAYIWLVGPIPDGMELDHLCFTHDCVNPAHLEPVTREENIRRYQEAVEADQHPTMAPGFVPRVGPIPYPLGP